MTKKIKYTHQVEIIDPRKARQYLTNVHPRQAGRDFRKLIISYAEEMKKGTWDVSVAQTISFDTNGALVDGWHRLHAIEQSGVSLPFLVVRGVDPDAFANYDAGRSRSMAFRRGVNKDQQAVIGAMIRVALYPYGSNRHTIEQCEVTEEFVKTDLDFFFEHASLTTKPRITTASLRAGVVCAMIAHPDRKVAIINAYNDLVHGNFGDAPRSMTSLYRRCMEDNRMMNMTYVALAWHAFNPHKFSNLKLMVRDLGSDIEEIKNKALKELVGAIS